MNKALEIIRNVSKQWNEKPTEIQIANRESFDLVFGQSDYMDMTPPPMLPLDFHRWTKSQQDVYSASVSAEAEFRRKQAMTSLPHAAFGIPVDAENLPSNQCKVVYETMVCIITKHENGELGYVVV